MIEKPRVLSEEEIATKFGGKCLDRSLNREAQRDADAAYYEPLIQQAKKDGYKQGVKDQYECQQIDLGQAKEEVAREIFEEIEQGYMRGGKHPRMDGIVISTPKSITISEPEWQSLKSKYKVKL